MNKLIFLDIDGTLTIPGIIADLMSDQITL